MQENIMLFTKRLVAQNGNNFEKLLLPQVDCGRFCTAIFHAETEHNCVLMKFNDTNLYKFLCFK